MTQNSSSSSSEIQDYWHEGPKCSKIKAQSSLRTFQGLKLAQDLRVINDLKCFGWTNMDILGACGIRGWRSLCHCPSILKVIPEPGSLYPQAMTDSAVHYATAHKYPLKFHTTTDLSVSFWNPICCSQARSKCGKPGLMFHPALLSGSKLGRMLFLKPRQLIAH